MTRTGGRAVRPSSARASLNRSERCARSVHAPKRLSQAARDPSPCMLSRYYPSSDCRIVRLPSTTRRALSLPTRTLTPWPLLGLLCRLLTCRFVAVLRGYPVPPLHRSFLSRYGVLNLCYCGCRSANTSHRFLRTITGRHYARRPTSVSCGYLECLSRGERRTSSQDFFTICSRK